MSLVNISAKADNSQEAPSSISGSSSQERERKKMEAKILQKFNGEINGVKFDDENNYYSSKFILEQVEEKFGECYSDEFVEKLRNTVSNMYLKYNEFSFAYLEEDFMDSIRKAEKFGDIKFLYGGGDWQIESLNEKIAEGAFEKKENLAQTKR